jgi:hypothetical protein
MGRTSIEPKVGPAIVPAPPYAIVKVEPVLAWIIGGGTSSVIPGAMVGVQIPQGGIVVTPTAARTGC